MKRFNYHHICLLLVTLSLAQVNSCADKPEHGHSHANEEKESDHHAHDEGHHDHEEHKHVHHDHDGHGSHSDEPKTQSNISEEAGRLAGLKTEIAQSRQIGQNIKLRGKITPSEHKIAHIIPRFSGVVREGRKHIGDKVAKGEVIAVLESNQSLQPFSVTSQIEGVVVKGHVIVGEYVPENQWIYIVSDLSEVWADLYASIRDAKNIALGQNVSIKSIYDTEEISGVVSYISPYLDERSQTRVVRVVLQNSEKAFLPGMYVTGDITTKIKYANVAVRKSAVQNYNNTTTVFVKKGNAYFPHKVSLGVSDSEWVEIVEGLSGGEEVVYQNSFLIKADLLSATAEHSH